MVVIDFFDRGWRINPNGVAFHMDGQDFTYTEIYELSCKIANGLIEAGYQKENRGAVWSKNHPISWTCTLSLWRAGMAWIPVNPMVPVTENQSQLSRFDAQVVFFTKEFTKKVNAIKNNLPQVKKWICIDGEVGANSLDDFVKDQPATPPVVDHQLNDLVALIPTGGTTGLPKACMNTNRSLGTFFTHFLMYINYPANIPPVNLVAAPMTHTAGILSMPTSALGGKVVVVTKPDPNTLFDIIKEHRITEFFLPPTVIYRMLGMMTPEEQKQAKASGQIDFSSLRYLIYGAAPMSVEKLKQAIEFFGPVMTEVYGQAEAPASITFLRPEEHFKNSIGSEFASDERLASAGRPTQFAQVGILDDENNLLPARETGEICVKGDLVMKAYYKNAEQTESTIIENWLHTGDVGHLDEEGYLYITDRKKDMIITGGFNVYPQAVEQVIWSHPSVQDCSVIGVPDEDWGEAVKAIVELKPGKTVDVAEIIAMCKEKLGSVKTPKTIDIVEELPRSHNGKVLKKDLRQMYAEK